MHIGRLHRHTFFINTERQIKLPMINQITARGAPAHVQNSVQMSERTDRKVLFERAELFEQFSSF